MHRYTYSITRYGDVETTIETANLLVDEKAIMAFYEEVITSDDRERILAAYNQEDFFDGFDYIKENLAERDIDLPPCKYSELMGDCRFYEGLETIDENHFRVLLGS